MHRRTLITTLTALASGCASAGDTAAPQPLAAEQRTAERINQTRAESGVAAGLLWTSPEDLWAARATVDA